jgi:uncharacterized protein (TIRG00374 family)
MKRKLLIILGWTVSLVVLYFAFKDIKPQELWQTLVNANYWWVIPNVLIVMFTMFYRAYRWQIMLDPIKQISLGNLFASTMVGFMASNILPLRMGEFVRAYSIGKLGKLSRSASFATIVLERIFDIFALLLLMAAILIGKRIPLKEHNYERVVLAGYLMLVLSIALLLLLIFLKIKKEPTLNFLRKMMKILPEKMSSLVLEIFEKFAEGLTVLGDLKRMVLISIHSMILWIITALSNYFIFLAFGLDVLPWDASFVVLIVVTLGITLPNAPGYIGVYHGLVILALSIYSLEVPDAAARGVAIVLHGAQYVSITAVGLFYLFRKHLSLHEAKVEAADDGN